MRLPISLIRFETPENRHDAKSAKFANRRNTQKLDILGKERPPQSQAGWVQKLNGKAGKGGTESLSFPVIG